MWDLITKLFEVFLDGKPGMQRLVLLLIYVAVTLVGLGGLWIASVMQVTARIIAPTATDWLTYTEQIGWTVGASATVFGVIWGLLLPHFKSYLDTQLIPDTNATVDREPSQASGQGEGK